jgi:hypothetical protein
VIILILEHVSLLYASSPDQTYEALVARAHFDYINSGTHTEVTNSFSTSQTYSITQITEFIIQNRL